MGPRWCNLRAVGKLELAVGHHRFAAREAAGNDGFALDHARDRDRLDLGDAIVDHKYVGAALADLDGGRRHGDRLFLTKGQPHRHQCSRPKKLVGVRHGGANGHHSRRRVHAVLDHGHLAARPPGVARDDGLDSRAFIDQRLAQVRQVSLRHRKSDIDRRGLDDGRERDQVGLADKVADLDGSHADATGDGSADRAIAELDVKVFQLPGIGINGGAPERHLGPRVVERDLGGGVLGDELGVAGNIAFGLLELRLRSLEQPLHLPDLGLQRAAVEGEQGITLPHHHAIAKVHADDLAVDACLDRDASDRRNAAKRLDTNGDGLLGGCRDLDRNRPGNRARRLGDGAA